MNKIKEKAKGGETEHHYRCYQCGGWFKQSRDLVCPVCHNQLHKEPWSKEILEKLDAEVERLCKKLPMHFDLDEFITAIKKLPGVKQLRFKFVDVGSASFQIDQDGVISNLKRFMGRLQHVKKDRFVDGLTVHQILPVSVKTGKEETQSLVNVYCFLFAKGGWFSLPAEEAKEMHLKKVRIFTDGDEPVPSNFLFKEIKPTKDFKWRS